MTVVPVKIEGSPDGAINRTLLQNGWPGNPNSGVSVQ
jgi:hypothetical protein